MGLAAPTVHRLTREAGSFHRHDRVLESWRGLIVRDLLDLDNLLLHAFIKGRRKIAVLDFVERRVVIGQRAFDRERIVVMIGGGHGGDLRAESKNANGEGMKSSHKNL